MMMMRKVTRKVNEYYIGKVGGGKVGGKVSRGKNEGQNEVRIWSVGMNNNIRKLSCSFSLDVSVYSSPF